MWTGRPDITGGRGRTNPGAVSMNPTALTPVWYLPGENRWRDLSLLAFKDSGRLLVLEDALEFQGKQERVVITDIRRVSLGKQGRDFVNDWVKVEYGSAASPATAFFADGSILGWGGVFGGTRRILAAVQHLAKGTPPSPLPPRSRP